MEEVDKEGVRAVRKKKKQGGTGRCQNQGTHQEGGVSDLQKGVSEEPEACVYVIIRI